MIFNSLSDLERAAALAVADKVVALWEKDPDLDCLDLSHLLNREIARAVKVLRDARLPKKNTD